MLLLLKMPKAGESLGPQVFVASARARKKPRSARAQFYSALMRTLGGQTGDDLGAAFTSGDMEKFHSLMAKLSSAMSVVDGRNSVEARTQVRTFEIVVRATETGKSVIHKPCLLDEAVSKMRVLENRGLHPLAREYVDRGAEKFFTFDEILSLARPTTPASSEEGA